MQEIDNFTSEKQVISTIIVKESYFGKTLKTKQQTPKRYIAADVTLASDLCSLRNIRQHFRRHSQPSDLLV